MNDGMVDRDAMVAEMRQTLRFYAEVANWHSASRGFAAPRDAAPSKAQQDLGKRARATLSRLAPAEEPQPLPDFLEEMAQQIRAAEAAGHLPDDKVMEILARLSTQAVRRVEWELSSCEHVSVIVARVMAQTAAAMDAREQCEAS